MLLQLCLLCSLRDRCFKFATEESLFRHVKSDDNHLKTTYQTLLISLNCPCTLSEFHLWSGEAAAFLFFSAVFRSHPFFCTGNWITEITIWHQPLHQFYFIFFAVALFLFLFIIFMCVSRTGLEDVFVSAAKTICMVIWNPDTHVFSLVAARVPSNLSQISNR